MPETNPILSPKVHFCPTPDGRIIATNGKGRGYIYVPDEGWYPLGFLPPLAAPIVNVSSGGQSYGGTYWIGVRYLDKWGNPSSLSPLAEVTVEYGKQFSYQFYASDEERQAAVQVFRSAVDTPGRLYCVHEQTTTKNQQVTVTDNLSDSQLLDRASLPLYYDDGRLYANIYEPPPKYLRVCVAFGDRYLYAVSPENVDLRNVICFSEPGNPEAVPFQQNAIRLSLSNAYDDFIRAIIPFGASLYVFTTRNCYRWVWGGDLYTDYTLVHVGPRGAINQNCVVAGQNCLYAMDHGGIWRIDRDGEIGDVSLPIADYWIDNRIDFTDLDLPFLLYDYSRRTVRAFVKYTVDGATHPQNALCYCERTSACWVESYPNHILRSGGTLIVEGRPEMVVGSSDGGVYRVDQRAMARDNQQYSDVIPAVGVRSYIITNGDISGTQIDLFMETTNNGVRYTAKRALQLTITDTKQTKLKLGTPLSVKATSGVATFGGYECVVLGGGYDWVVLECPSPLENGFPQYLVGETVTFTAGPAAGQSRTVASIETSWIEAASSTFSWSGDYGTTDIKDWVAAIDGFYRSSLFGTVHSPSWNATLEWIMDNSQYASAPGTIPFDYITPPYTIPTNDGTKQKIVPVLIYFETAPVDEWFNIQILDHNGVAIPVSVQHDMGSVKTGPDYVQVSIKRSTADYHDRPGIVRIGIPVTGHKHILGNPWIRIRIFGNQSNYRVRIKAILVGSQGEEQVQ